MSLKGQSGTAGHDDHPQDMNGPEKPGHDEEWIDLSGMGSGYFTHNLSGTAGRSGQVIIPL
jgi:hypothetical protein